jgi:phospholipase D1/2
LNWVRALLMAGIVVAIGGLYAADMLRYFTPDAIAELLAGSSWGPLLFLGLFVIGEMLTVPSVLFIMGASLVWPFGPAFLIGWVGGILSATIVFLFYRYAAASWVQRVMPSGIRLWEDRLQRDGIRGVITVRLVTFLHPATHPAMAVSRVSLRDYVLGTAIGIIPGVVLVVAFGEPVVRWISGAPLAALGVVGAIAGVVVLIRRFRGRAAPLQPDVESSLDDT